MGILQEQRKVSKGKKNNVYNTETMLPISEIRNTTVVLRDGGVRAIIKVTGLNLDLRNYDEQVSVIEQYKKFLNGLTFPMQILVRSTYLDLSDYITYASDQIANLTQKSLKAQGDSYVEFLDTINAKTGLIYVKEFYIIVPYYSMEDDSNNIRKSRRQKFIDALSPAQTAEQIVKGYRSFLRNEKFLDTRVNLILEWLKGIWVYGERLGISDIISLLFRVYNPEAHKNMSENTVL
jgi:hypothetical protein